MMRKDTFPRMSSRDSVLGSIVFPQWKPGGSEDAEEGPFSKEELIADSDK